jgi:hypothetical protein
VITNIYIHYEPARFAHQEAQRLGRELVTRLSTRLMGAEVHRIPSEVVGAEGHPFHVLVRIEGGPDDVDLTQFDEKLNEAVTAAIGADRRKEILCLRVPDSVLQPH